MFNHTSFETALNSKYMKWERICVVKNRESFRINVPFYNTTRAFWGKCKPIIYDLLICKFKIKLSKKIE